MLKFAASTAIGLLIATGATRGWAEKGGKKEAGDSSINRQFDWENKVVGPKEGLDHDRLAAIQEKGRRDEEARKKEPPKKQERAKGLNEAGSASLPTMDIEKPAPASKKTTKKVAVAEPPRRKDSLDNLLDEQGAKPFSESHAAKKDDGGLNNLFASDDKPTHSRAANGGGRKPAKKARRR